MSTNFMFLHCGLSYAINYCLDVLVLAGFCKRCCWERARSVKCQNNVPAMIFCKLTM